MHKVAIPIACDLIKYSDQHYKHASVITLNGEIIATGYNHGDTKYNRVSIHSEVATILNAVRGRKLNVNSSTIYVVRLNRSGEFRDSKPCLNCLRYMKKHGVKYVVYSTEQGMVKMCVNYMLDTNNTHRDYIVYRMC